MLHKTRFVDLIYAVIIIGEMNSIRNSRFEAHIAPTRVSRKPRLSVWVLVPVHVYVTTRWTQRANVARMQTVLISTYENTLGDSFSLDAPAGRPLAVSHVLRITRELIKPPNFWMTDANVT